METPPRNLTLRKSVNFSYVKFNNKQLLFQTFSLKMSLIPPPQIGKLQLILIFRRVFLKGGLHRKNASKQNYIIFWGKTDGDLGFDVEVDFHGYFEVKSLF